MKAMALPDLSVMVMVSSSKPLSGFTVTVTLSPLTGDLGEVVTEPPLPALISTEEEEEEEEPPPPPPLPVVGMLMRVSDSILE